MHISHDLKIKIENEPEKAYELGYERGLKDGTIQALMSQQKKYYSDEVMCKENDPIWLVDQTQLPKYSTTAARHPDVFINNRKDTNG